MAFWEVVGERDMAKMSSKQESAFFITMLKGVKKGGGENDKKRRELCRF